MPLFAGKKIKMDQQQNMELTKDQIIQELIALLNQNQQREAANNVFEMAALIDGMEKRLESVTEELVTVKVQLRKMEEREAEKGLQQQYVSWVQQVGRIHLMIRRSRARMMIMVCKQQSVLEKE